MSEHGPMKPREVYEAYLKGKLTPDQAGKAVQDWYQSPRPAPPTSPKKD